MIKLSELLKLRGLDLKKKIKVVRHRDDDRFDVDKLYSNGQLIYYQSHQEQNKFADCDFIVSFLGIEKGKAKLIGVYQVLTCTETKEWFLPKDFLYKDFKKSNYYYDLKEVRGFEDYINRVIIDWGPGAINWAQWLNIEQGKDKEVVEILPVGYFKPFPGYDSLILSYQELKEVVNSPDSNKQWHTMLSAVAGIYLIVDKVSGNQYVGSCYGKEGILGRWKSYASNGHGGNKELRKILGINSNNIESLQFSILKTLPLSMSKKEVILYESLFKKKLDTINHGLNLN